MHTVEKKALTLTMPATDEDSNQQIAIVKNYSTYGGMINRAFGPMISTVEFTHAKTSRV